MSQFVRSEGKWKRYTQVRQGHADDSEPCYEWVDCSITNVPIPILIDEYENLTWELTSKEVELSQVKEEYAEKEFQIKYVEDIDFKELYGKANDDVRKHHVKVVCSDLLKSKTDLELSVDFLKREIALLKTVIGFRTHQGPMIDVKIPNINRGRISYDDCKKQVEKAVKDAHKMV